MNLDNEISLQERLKNIDLSALTVAYIALYVFLLAFTFFVRPDTPTNRYILNNFGLDIHGIGFLILVVSGLVPLMYYVLKSSTAVILVLSPVLAIDLILMLQVIQSETAPLEHLLNALFVLISFPILFLLLESLDIERNINKRLAQKNAELQRKLDERA